MDEQRLAAFAEVGSVLADRYQILEVLGTGGMGIVVAAEHLRLKERVAIKLLRPQPLSSAKSVQRFLQEARAASKIKSQHVVRMLDADLRADGTPYLVMEYLEGQTLAAQLRAGRPEPREAVDWVLQAAEALAEAHALGIVHRDLKPSNLFLVRGRGGVESLKVLDFGISKVVSDAAVGGDWTTSGEGLLGSPPYMSPEQITRPSAVDARSDIWSLGAVLYECLTGCPPFPGESAGGIFAKILQSSPRPILELNPELPPALARVVERCLQKNEEDRFANMLELSLALVEFGGERARTSLAAIQLLQRELGISAPAAPRLVRPVPLSERETTTLSPGVQDTHPAQARRRALLATIGVVALALVGAALLLHRRPAMEKALPQPPVLSANGGPRAESVPSAQRAPDVVVSPPIASERARTTRRSTTSSRLQPSPSASSRTPEPDRSASPHTPPAIPPPLDPESDPAFVDRK